MEDEVTRVFAGTTVAFDIETVPRLIPTDLPERELEKLSLRARDEARRQSGLEEPSDHLISSALEKALALNPLTNRIVSVAFCAHRESAELALVVSPTSDLDPPMMATSEAEALRTFWTIARVAERLVGYSSRRFDIPVILMRSALCGIEASVDLLTGRNNPKSRHIDLAESLGGQRHPSLELLAFTFGIDAKKQGHGSDVKRLVEEECFEELGTYNLEDARATALLHERLIGTFL